MRVRMWRVRRRWWNLRDEVSITGAIELLGGRSLCATGLYRFQWALITHHPRYTFEILQVTRSSPFFPSTKSNQCSPPPWMHPPFYFLGQSRDRRRAAERRNRCGGDSSHGIICVWSLFIISSSELAIYAHRRLRHLTPPLPWSSVKYSSKNPIARLISPIIKAAIDGKIISLITIHEQKIEKSHSDRHFDKSQPECTRHSFSPPFPSSSSIREQHSYRYLLGGGAPS